MSRSFSAILDSARDAIYPYTLHSKSWMLEGVSRNARLAPGKDGLDVDTLVAPAETIPEEIADSGFQFANLKKLGAQVVAVIYR